MVRGIKFIKLGRPNLHFKGGVVKQIWMVGKAGLNIYYFFVDVIYVSLLRSHKLNFVWLLGALPSFFRGALGDFSLYIDSWSAV